MRIEATKPFLDLHVHLRDHVEHLPVAAHELPELSADERIDVVERIVAFLCEVLLPHAAAEERVLYPRAARLLGKPDDSGVAALDEHEVRRRIAQLEAADPVDVGHLQELLYAIYTLMCAHFWREEQLYLELLASPREDDAFEILSELSQAAA